MMQPYATLFALGLLRIDDRSWPTSYRGPVAIHASRKLHADYDSFIRTITGWDYPQPSELPHGAVVGVANLADCLAPAPVGSAVVPNHTRAHFGAPGFYGFVLEGAQPVKPVPLRGNVRLFDMPEATLARLLSENAHLAKQLHSPSRT